jgi:hypothetical protein
MAGSEDVDERALVREIAAEIHRFLQSYPNHYASRALANLLNRTVAGDDVGDDERELVLLTLAREAKNRARGERFGR